MDTISVNYVVKGPQWQVWRFRSYRFYVIGLAVLVIASVVSFVAIYFHYLPKNPQVWIGPAFGVAGEVIIDALLIVIMFYGDNFYPNRHVTLSPNGEVVVENVSLSGRSTGYRFVCGAYERDKGYYFLYSTTGRRTRGVFIPEAIVTPEVLTFLSQLPEKRYR
jgi:hypothetical protein